MNDWITITPRDLYGAAGHPPGDPATGYLRRWTPVLGPTSTLLYHHLQHATTEGPVPVQLSVLAAGLGVGKGTGRNSILVGAIRRLGRYGMLLPEVGTDGTHLYLATTLPPVSVARRDRPRAHPDPVDQIGTG